MKTFLIAASLLFIACDDPTEPARNGRGCEVNEDCESELCLHEFIELDLPGGLCTDECGLFNPCASTEHCIVSAVNEDSFCTPRCWNNDQCRPSDGWLCKCLDSQCMRKGCMAPWFADQWEL